MKLEIQETKIAIIGLGYVGLPLAIAFAEKFEVIGYDISTERIKSLNNGVDHTNEVSSAELKQTSCTFTDTIYSLNQANVFIIGVPTPIDDQFRPNLNPLKFACENVAKVLKCGDTVIFESTVYPGTTEEVCVPILSSVSGLEFNRDYHVGYSPERINPGDKNNTLKNIPKVVSGSCPKTTAKVNWLYSSILKAKTHVAPNIKTAEMSKIIENTQRDMNIAVMNEFSCISSNIGIDLYDVLDAAKTKWNFLPFTPGLVGGHCIGVDPYYLIEKSTVSGYLPELLSAGRKLNETMPNFIFNKIQYKANEAGIILNGARVLILGLTFKPNCPDVRNTKVLDIIKHFSKWGSVVTVEDPWISSDDIKRIEAANNVKFRNGETSYDIIVHAVNHEDFTKYTYSSLKENTGAKLIFDLHGKIKGAETVYT